MLLEHLCAMVHIVDLDFLPHLYISSGLKKEAGGSIEEEGDSSTIAIHVVVDEPPKVVCFLCGVQYEVAMPPALEPKHIWPYVMVPAVLLLFVNSRLPGE